MLDKVHIKGKLLTLYEKAKDEKFDEVIYELEHVMRIKSLVNYYTHAVTEFDDDDKDIVELIVRILQEIYNNAQVPSPIRDEEYDQLYEVYRDISGQEIVGASVGARDKAIAHHKYPDLRGTLDKIHFFSNEEKGRDNRKSLQEWLNSIANRIGRPLYQEETVVTLFPKWDGISAIFECDGEGNVIRVLSRGDTDKNEAIDYTPMFKGTNMNSLNEFNNGEFGVKTEIVISFENYKKLCEKFGDFKNPRSAVSSIFNSKDLDRKYLPYLTVIPLQVQDYETKRIVIPRETLEMYPNITIPNILDFKKVRESVEAIKEAVDEQFGIDIDGVVLRLNNEHIQRILGREGKINKYEVAYKLPAPSTKTKLKDVIFSVGVMGSITPVAQIEPVVLKGNTIDSPSLGSIDRFEELDLREGDEVIIRYDVVPYLYIDETCKKGTGRKFTTPTHCPYCQEPLVREPVLRCVNLDCSSRKIGKVMNYVDKMRIPNISIGTITTFFKHKFIDGIEDLYLLKRWKSEILQLNGFGEKLFQKIIDGIESRKDVYDYELLGALGIPDIGEKIFKKILNIYYLDELIQLCINNKLNKLTEIGGIKEKTAEKIITGIKANEKLIKFLRSVLNVKRDNRKYTIKVTFTKVRDKDFEKYLDSKGVLVLDNYNKEVDILIIRDKSVESSKVEKARRDGKEIVTIEEAYKMFNYQK